MARPAGATPSTRAAGLPRHTAPAFLLQKARQMLVLRLVLDAQAVHALPPRGQHQISCPFPVRFRRESPPPWPAPDIHAGTAQGDDTGIAPARAVEALMSPPGVKPSELKISSTSLILKSRRWRYGASDPIPDGAKPTNRTSGSWRLGAWNLPFRPPSLRARCPYSIDYRSAPRNERTLRGYGRAADRPRRAWSATCGCRRD